MKHTFQNCNYGFTLIETVIYLALFSIIIGGAIVSTYSLFESVGRNQTIAELTQEGNFLEHKINWEIYQAQTISTPADNSTSTTLEIETSDSPSQTVRVQMTDGNISISRENGQFVNLNNTNTMVQNLFFIHTNTSSFEYIQTQFTLATKTPDGKDISHNFSIKTYVKK